MAIWFIDFIDFVVLWSSNPVKKPCRCERTLSAKQVYVHMRIIFRVCSYIGKLLGTHYVASGIPANNKPILQRLIWSN
jgi:hypothetical protein